MNQRMLRSDGLSGRRVCCWRRYYAVVQRAAALRPAALPLATRRASPAAHSSACAVVCTQNTRARTHTQMHMHAHTHTRYQIYILTLNILFGHNEALSRFCKMTEMSMAGGCSGAWYFGVAAAPWSSSCTMEWQLHHGVAAANQARSVLDHCSHLH